MSKMTRNQRLLWTALSVQLLALLIGFVILYTCASGGIPSHNHSETAFWGTIGIVRFMSGNIMPRNWKKVSFLSTVAFFLWGAFWIFVTYTICAPDPD